MQLEQLAEPPLKGGASRIEEYGLLGDCYSAALVGKDGSIDWLCWPRFDSDACFAALLGTPDNGRWLLAPVDARARVSRRYREDTLILETRFKTDAAVVVIEFIPPHGGPPDLIRIVAGERLPFVLGCGASHLAPPRTSGCGTRAGAE